MNRNLQFEFQMKAICCSMFFLKIYIIPNNIFQQRRYDGVVFDGGGESNHAMPIHGDEFL